MKLTIVSLISLLLLTACEVATPDGDIPAQYVALAQDYTGVYQGKFEKTEGTLDLRIDSYNRPILKFTAIDGNSDIIGKDCQSVIGDLVSVYPRKKKGKVWLASATFAFNPSRCRSIEGRSITVAFSHKEGQPVALTASIVKYSREWESCSGSGEDRSCSSHTDYTYLSGKFSKQ